MGSLIGKFRAKPSTVEILGKIDRDIRDLRDYENFNNLRYKKYHAKLMMYALLFTFIGIAVLYFYHPLSWTHRILSIFGIATIPLIIKVIINLMKLYYENQKSDYDIKIKELLNQKEEILNNIKNTETYKNAIEILEKFEDHHGPRRISPMNQANGKSPTSLDIRKRIIKSASTPPATQNNSSPSHRSPLAILACVSTPPNDSSHHPNFDTTLKTGGKNGIGIMARCGPPQTPRPILAQTSGYLDRFLEFLINDGPDYRYALICKNCFSHNGMAMKEEFEFLSFRCAYCDHFNTSRKHRPSAPTLEEWKETDSDESEKTLRLKSVGMGQADVRKKLNFKANLPK